MAVQEAFEGLRDFYDTVKTLLEQTPDEELFRRRPERSGWSPAEHLYHALVATGAMLKGIRLLVEGTHPHAVAEGAPNRVGRLILARGRMPRGKAEAPEAVRPPEHLTREQLEEAYVRSRKALDRVEPLLPALGVTTLRAPHPFFGALTASEWLRIARIHSWHHLEIVRELLHGD